MRQGGKYQTSRSISKQYYESPLRETSLSRRDLYPKQVQICERIHASNITMIKYTQLHIIQILIRNHCHSVQHQLDFRPRQHRSQDRRRKGIFKNWHIWLQYLPMLKWSLSDDREVECYCEDDVAVSFFTLSSLPWACISPSLP